MKHPAREWNFANLYGALLSAVGEGLVYEHRGVGDMSALRLYTYSDETVYERRWSPITLMARGLILDVESSSVVATPFPKFFNVQELDEGFEGSSVFADHFKLPSGGFEVFDKLDGSLIIIFYWRGEWRCATKGSLASDQAKWAQTWLHHHCDLSMLDKSCTYLCEAIYPENKIVIRYDDCDTGLHLLGAYDGVGEEISSSDLRKLAEKLNWSVARPHAYDSIAELLEIAGRLDSQSEGFVLRFVDCGTRVKIKGDEYCRIHRLISGLTPLGVWRMMMEDSGGVLGSVGALDTVRRELPEEFLADFDCIVNIFNNKLQEIVSMVTVAAQGMVDLTDKEIGLRLTEFSEVVRKFIFPFRKNNGNILQGRTRDAVFRMIRPDRNVLEGYRASSSMVRVLDGIE